MKVLNKYLGKQLARSKILNYEDFKRVFCRCLFKDSLIDLSESIETLEGLDKNAPLVLKLGIYQRKLMMNGIEKEGDENIQGRHIMNALNDMREDNIKPVRYESFV